MWRPRVARVAPAVVSHYNAQTAFDIFGNVQGTDLGFVAAQFDKVIEEARKDLPKGSQIHLKGQVETMRQSFRGLLIGLVGAIVLVYMLIVVNFQSLLDPFIIITALPAALAGHRLDAVPDPHHGERTRTHRRHHVHGRGHREQRTGDQLCARAHECRR